MTYRRTPYVEVRLFGEPMGAVAWDARSQAYVFEYVEEFARRGIEPAPLTMPVGPRQAYVFPELDRRSFLGLPGMLADALPDRFGNALVDAWMARHGIERDQITALDRLAYAGTRSVGALEFYPPARGDGDEVQTAVQLADLVIAARSAVDGVFPAGGEGSDQASNDAINALIQVGTSAGGVRAKAVVAFNPATGQLRSGQLDAPAGFEHWLIKLDGVGEDGQLASGAGYGRVEYAYHLMARAAGVEVADARLLTEFDRAHFMTRRFDRTSEGKMHVQSLCAIAHLDYNQVDTHDYRQYLQVIGRLGLGAQARRQAFRRIVLNVASINRDDHTKNHAFLMDADGRWSLAPAYDLTFAYNPSGVWTQRHQLGVNGRFEGIDRNHLVRFAEDVRVEDPDEVIDEVLEQVSRFGDFAAEAGVDPETTAAITSVIERFWPGDGA